mgnify:FL=1
MRNFLRKSALLMAASLAFFACDDEKKVPETVVTLDRTELNLNVGFSETLVATVTPPLQDGVTVAWSTDDEVVAKVEDGVVTALAAGEATITASVGESKATCKVTVAYVAPKIGDYYYSDGTWSDGGLVSIEADGLNPVWADTKPAPVAGKTVIGIVCQTDENRIAAGDKEKGYTHGYVMALKNAHGPDKTTTWWSGDMEFSCLKGAKLASTWYGHLNGYDDTMTVLATYGDNINLMPAFDWTLNSFPLAAPASSSGWFLPSTGQLWDMIANFCGHDVAVIMKGWQTLGRDATWYCSEKVGYDALARINSVMSEIPDADKDVLEIDDEKHKFCSLWASTPYDDESACLIEIGTDGMIECMANWYNADCYARPILAF